MPITSSSSCAVVSLNVIKIDASYMIATAQNSPLDQTLRFTLSFDLDGIKDLFGRN